MLGPASREPRSNPAHPATQDAAPPDDSEVPDTAPQLGDDSKAANGEILPDHEAGPDGFPAQRPCQ